MVFTNLRAAIDGAIAANVHMIVYAQTWEYGGNLDGKGFINAQFDKAIAHGIRLSLRLVIMENLRFNLALRSAATELRNLKVVQITLNFQLPKITHRLKSL